MTHGHPMSRFYPRLPTVPESTVEQDGQIRVGDSAVYHHQLFVCLSMVLMIVPCDGIDDNHAATYAGCHEVNGFKIVKTPTEACAVWSPSLARRNSIG